MLIPNMALKLSLLKTSKDVSIPENKIADCFDQIHIVCEIQTRAMPHKQVNVSREQK